MRPSYNKLRVLSGLRLGDFEAQSFFLGVEVQTFHEMAAKGWIEAAPVRDTLCYRVSDLGLTMHRRYE